MKFIGKQIIGKEFETHSCGYCVVVDYKSCYDVTVNFLKPFHIAKCTLTNLRKGNVNNPMFPKVCGKGYIGIGQYSTKDRFIYTIWKGMITRAYGENFNNTRNTYKDVTVCDEWLNFQNFASWMLSQPFFDNKDVNGKSYELDKDILVKHNKIYSPETCCFVPKEINLLLSTNKIRRGKYPIGVKVTPYNKFQATVIKARKTDHLGNFNTPEEAFQAYKKAKEDYIKEVAEKWKSSIDKKLYYSLLSWKVDVND